MTWANMLDFIVNTGNSIYESFQEVFYFFTLSIGDNILRIVAEDVENPNLYQRSVLNMASYFFNILDWLAPYTIFELMFGVGLYFVIGWTLVSWVIDLLP